MLWIEFFLFCNSIVHFVILILLNSHGTRPICAFERASMDWILQGLTAAIEGFLSFRALVYIFVGSA